MKALFWILAICAAAVGLTLAARYNAGYVLLVVPPYRAEVSLNLLLLALALVFAAGYALVRLVATALAMPSEVRAWRERRARDKARAHMVEGLKAFFEERVRQGGEGGRGGPRAPRGARHQRRGGGARGP